MKKIFLFSFVFIFCGINQGPDLALNTVEDQITTVSELLRICTQLLNPVMPNKTTVILNMLGSTFIALNNYSTNLIKVGQKLGDGKSPFPRITI